MLSSGNQIVFGPKYAASIMKDFEKQNLDQFKIKIEDQKDERIMSPYGAREGDFMLEKKVFNELA